MVPMFRIRGLSRAFAAAAGSVRALDSINLDVAPGSFTAIVGPSGCGKTTLLRIMAGFDSPDHGTVSIRGRIVAGQGIFVRPEHRNIGFVTQEGSLFPHLSVAANVAYGLPGWGRQLWSAHTKRRRRDRVAQILRLVGLQGYERRFPAQLSGGQQQRVALARALAPNPAALLLDEPFSALDAALRTELRQEVRELLAKLGATTILVTHDQNEALSLADHVALMRAGRIIQDGTPPEVYAAPADPEAAAFLGEAVELPCRVVASEGGLLHIECPLGNACVSRAAVHSRDRGSILVLRPEQIELAEDEGTLANVASASYFGHDSLAKLHLADGTLVQVRTQGGAVPPVGSMVRVRLQNTLTTPQTTT